MIRVHWPGRTPDSLESLEKAQGDVACLLPSGVSAMPTAFEVVRNVDLLGGFRGKRKFVEVAEKEIPKFYGEVGQHLRKWVPPAPKIKRKPEDPDAVSVGEASEEAKNAPKI